MPVMGGGCRIWRLSDQTVSFDVMQSTDPNRTLVAARLRWLLVMGLLAANVAFFTLGAIAAAVGGDLSEWGKGPGGLGGWADFSMTLFSFSVGLAAAVATFRERRSILVAGAVFATGLLVGTGFLTGGHLADPCDRGWWDGASAIGDAPLCDSLGDIALRFHLLLHGIFGVLSAGAAAFIYRRKNLFVWWPPAG